MDEKLQSSNYKKYNSKNPLMGIVISNFIKNLKESLAPLEDINKVIDIGCGEGFILNYLDFSDMTGMDISKNALKVAKEKNPACSLCTGSIYSLSFKKEIFDLVIATEVLEHLNEPERALEEIRRVSKRYSIFSVPNEPYFSAANFMRGKNIPRLGNDIDHVQNWSAREFTNLLEDYFEVVEVRKPFPWTMAVCEK